ncbi:MAG: aldo/keto reductase [Spirochaetales bacterium]|nr:aldo/keto reductase [Spirochaetales bacterium]
MKRRQLGNTGLMVSEIGFGAFQIGDEYARGRMSLQEAVSLVHAARDAGCNFFDTAPLYGGGKSEEILGVAFSGRREEVIINTKCGHYPGETGRNFDPALIRESVEKSLGRLKTDYIDSLILHNPPGELLSASAPHYEVFERLKEEGKIRAYGASLDWSHELFALIDNTKSRVIEVLFNIFHQEPKTAFGRAEAKGVGLIVKVPFDSGWLSGRYDGNTIFTDLRRRWTPEIKARREILVRKVGNLMAMFGISDSPGESYIKTALGFVLSFAGISTVIPGFKNLKQVTSCFSAAEQPLTKKLIVSFEELWNTELKDDPVPW